MWSLHTICYQNIPASHILYEELIFRQFLKEIHNNYNGLYGCDIYALSINVAGDRNRIAIFYFLLANRRHQFLVVPQIICERHLQSLATDAFLRIWFFTDMDFLESFQAVALGLLSYLVMRTINHTIIFLTYFLFSSSFFMA